MQSSWDATKDSEEVSVHRLIEICLTDLASAIAATAGGADRIELCADLDSGGVTASAGLIAEVVARCPIPIHVLIRPRAGDFVYDEHEVVVMRRDIDIACSLGAAGVVVGALRGDATVDVETIAGLVERARSMSVTFHRAIDLTPDPLATIDALVAIGVDRVLSSGGRGPARAGLDMLRAMVNRAAGRLVVMAGGGIVEADLPELLNKSEVNEVHLASGVAGRRPEAGPFGRGPGVVEAARVARMVARVRGEIRA